MTSYAYYNEHDPFAAEWLRYLIAYGAIAPGEVDERSIEDVHPDDLRPFKQCHFFAGIGVWSYALRRAGWDDDRRIWTASCPCQPFSEAGEGAGFADERHLFPALYHLIGAVEPECVVGEQVASKAGLAWLDLVQADIEAAGYAFGAIDICAAGIGAPHIRQREWWAAARGVADAAGGRSRTGLRDYGSTGQRGIVVTNDGSVSRLDHHHHQGSQGYAGDDGATQGRSGPGRSVAAPSVSSGLADANCVDTAQVIKSDAGINQQWPTQRWRAIESPGAGAGGRISDGAYSEGCSALRTSGPVAELERPSPTNGYWRDVDWLKCRDGKWRPVEPGTFPLVNGTPNRVGRLRGYGNAIVAPLAQIFIEEVMQILA